MTGNTETFIPGLYLSYPTRERNSHWRSTLKPLLFRSWDFLVVHIWEEASLLQFLISHTFNTKVEIKGLLPQTYT